MSGWASTKAEQCYSRKAFKDIKRRPKLRPIHSDSASLPSHFPSAKQTLQRYILLQLMLFSSSWHRKGSSGATEPKHLLLIYELSQVQTLFWSLALMPTPWFIFPGRYEQLAISTNYKVNLSAHQLGPFEIKSGVAVITASFCASAEVLAQLPIIKSLYFLVAWLFSSFGSDRLIRHHSVRVAFLHKLTMLQLSTARSLQFFWNPLWSAPQQPN